MEIDVYVSTLENAKGQLELSRRKAKLLKAWDALCRHTLTTLLLKEQLLQNKRWTYCKYRRS